MKRYICTILVICLLCSVLFLSGCGGQKDSGTVPGESTVILVQLPEGLYVEEIAKRGSMIVSDAGNNSIEVRIDWPGSAFSRGHWEMTAVYDSQKQAYVYSDAVRIDTEYNEQGQANDTVVYTRGSGSFTPQGNKLIWTNEKEPDMGENSFVYEMSLADYESSQAITPEPVPSVAPADTPEPSIQPVIVPTAAPAPTEAPTPTAAPSPTPTPEALPIITKSPTDETLTAGGSCLFIAKYENAIWAVWHFVSPDGKIDMTYDVINTKFPTLEVINGMYSSMTLQNVPYEMNGWRVYCRYTNNAGSSDTKTALITVLPAPSPTPGPSIEPVPEPTEEPGPIINIWTDTTSLEEAIQGSGIDFIPPDTQSIPKELSFKTYRYCTGTIEVDYVDDNGDKLMIVRKSIDESGLSLSGDYNTYSSSWDIVLKGLTIHCLGDGETANTLYYGYGNENFSISYYMGQEGHGLTPDQIQSIAFSIQ